MLCPRRDKPGSVWLPGYWQRQHIMYTSALLFVVLLMALEFSFSSFFSQNALAFMMIFKVVWVRELCAPIVSRLVDARVHSSQIYMESWLLKTLNEKLVALPFECALQTAQFVMTLGTSPAPSSCHACASRFSRACAVTLAGADGVRDALLSASALDGTLRSIA